MCLVIAADAWRVGVVGDTKNVFIIKRRHIQYRRWIAGGRVVERVKILIQRIGCPDGQHTGQQEAGRKKLPHRPPRMLEYGVHAAHLMVIG